MKKQLSSKLATQPRRVPSTQLTIVAGGKGTIKADAVDMPVASDYIT